MVEVYPCVKVVSTEMDIQSNFRNAVFFDFFPSYDLATKRYGPPNLASWVKIIGYFLPTDEIYFADPNGHKIFTVNNSFHYVSSGGAFRNSFWVNYKNYNCASIHEGSGTINCALVFPTENELWLTGKYPIAAHPLFYVEDDISLGWVDTTVEEEIKRIDLGANKMRNCYILSRFKTDGGGTGQKAHGAVEISEDGETWTRVAEWTWDNPGPTDKKGLCLISNTKFRWVRWLGYTEPDAFTLRGYIRKIISFEG